jgi:Domain of unknown function (DUF3291)
VAASAHQLAELNVALPLEPLDTPRLAEFVAALEPVNAVADASPGFVWRLQTEEGDATSIRVFDDERIIINLSVWDSLEALRGFVYGRPHREFLARRREWFEQMAEAYLALWWVPAGHIPTVEEAVERLETLRAQGSGPRAFSFREHFPPPVEAASR